MLNRKALVLVVGLWSLAATAQVPVVEAGGRGQQPAAQPENNQLMMSLYTQLESLQQEIQTLRGMVEEQSNQLRRLQTEQRDRYIDVDRRLSELRGSAGATPPAMPGADPAGNLPGANTGGTTPPPAQTGFPAPANNPQITNNAPSVSLGNAPPAAGPAPSVAGQVNDTQLDEQDLYRTALNMLLEQRPEKYQESIRLFRTYITRFPEGRLLTNAYYWLGEALILVEGYAEARDVFNLLVNSYPQDPKAAGAMLKLGDVYQRMGDRGLAEQNWREISVRYPENVTEIREAQSRLRGE